MPEPNTETKPVKTVGEYAERIRELTEGKRRVFRGQANADWALESAALRRIKDSKGYRENIAQQQFVEYHRDLINRVRDKGHGYEGSRSLHDLELLAKLQHYGAATAFIDFTKNIYVALWFAIDPLIGGTKDGKVFILNHTGTSKFRAVKEEDVFSDGNKTGEEGKIEYFLTPQVSDSGTGSKAQQPPYWYWEAQRVRAERIIRQSSIFVFGKPEIDEGDYEEVVIANGAKEKIRSELSRLHDINPETLFPDFPGLAVANGVRRYYHIKNAREHRKEGDRHFQIGKYKEAIDCFSRAIEIEPRDAVAYFSRGFSYGELGNHKKAISDYTEAIKIAPSAVEAYYNRGNSYAKLGKYEEAISDYTEAIKIAPSAAAYINRGNSYAKLGKHEEAISDYTEAIEIDPQYAYAYTNRGISYAKLGKYEEAISDYTEAIEIDPQYANASYGRALSKHALNSKDKSAEEDILKALNLAREQGKQDLVKQIAGAMREWGMAVPD